MRCLPPARFAPLDGRPFGVRRLLRRGCTGQKSNPRTGVSLVVAELLGGELRFPLRVGNVSLDSLAERGNRKGQWIECLIIPQLSEVESYRRAFSVLVGFHPPNQPLKSFRHGSLRLCVRSQRQQRLQRQSRL